MLRKMAGQRIYGVGTGGGLGRGDGFALEGDDLTDTLAGVGEHCFHLGGGESRSAYDGK